MGVIKIGGPGPTETPDGRILVAAPLDSAVEGALLLFFVFSLSFLGIRWSFSLGSFPLLERCSMVSEDRSSNDAEACF